MAYYSREKTLTIKTHLNVINKTYSTTIRDDSFFFYIDLHHTVFVKRLHSAFFIHKEERL